MWTWRVRKPSPPEGQREPVILTLPSRGNRGESRGRTLINMDQKTNSVQSSSCKGCTVPWMGLLSVPLDLDTGGACHISAYVGTGRTRLLGRPQQIQCVNPSQKSLQSLITQEPALCPSLDIFGSRAGDWVCIRVFLHCLPTVESTHDLLGWFLFFLSKNVGCELIS